jgi:hypothetical protein
MRVISIVGRLHKSSEVIAFHAMSGPTKRPSRTLLTWMLIGTAFYLFCNLFLPWHTPILQSGDQVYFWMDAQRMLHGERAYVDFF